MTVRVDIVTSGEGQDASFGVRPVERLRDRIGERVAAQAVVGRARGRIRMLDLEAAEATAETGEPYGEAPLPRHVIFIR